MTARKERPKEDCALCNGRGWFYTNSGSEKSNGWPAFCHRCYSAKYIEMMRAPSTNRSAVKGK